MLRRTRIRRSRRGFRVDLPAEERQVLQRLLPQLRQLLAGDGPDDERTRRLFPPAYLDDREADEEYQRLMHDELRTSRLAALDAVEATIGATELSEEQLTSWMASINSVRLVLGTMLDVSEGFDLDDVPVDDADVESYVLYTYLSALLEEIVQALTPR